MLICLKAGTRLPTVLIDGKSTLGPRSARKRRHETIEAAAKIHGSTREHSSATYDGMFDTLQKRCKLHTLTQYVTGNRQLTNRVVSSQYTRRNCYSLKIQMTTLNGVLQLFIQVV